MVLAAALIASTVIMELENVRLSFNPPTPHTPAVVLTVGFYYSTAAYVVQVRTAAAVFRAVSPAGRPAQSG